MAGIVNYISESYNELKNHVTWPSYSEAQRLAVIVLSFSVVFSIIVWGVDSFFNELMEVYFNWVKS